MGKEQVKIIKDVPYLTAMPPMIAYLASSPFRNRCISYAASSGSIIGAIRGTDDP